LHIVISRTWDVMWELDTAWIWTIIELNLAIVAASAPALKSFFQHCLLKPTASLYKRARTPGLSVSADRDDHRQENGMLDYRGEKEDDAPRVEEIGRAL
jgi:hypothetical protein